MRSPNTRPRWAEALLFAILPADDVKSVTGDLHEVYRDEQLPSRGRAGADRWYVQQVALAFAGADDERQDPSYRRKGHVIVSAPGVLDRMNGAFRIVVTLPRQAADGA
jgi:hypothetical protein